MSSPQCQTPDTYPVLSVEFEGKQQQSLFVWVFFVGREVGHQSDQPPLSLPQYSTRREGVREEGRERERVPAASLLCSISLLQTGTVWTQFC